ncbi:expressed unknown protein [Seminavis robusta]|uniref:Uncharacterized protein n=1 Tax=Seminavis robusta TaxID=568900 RepID=A0A9N8H3U7_9STRA|nr:expressed unknown protein [Seminavis robusta]|eukprot:Sro34_g021830.1 n/a (178) ;mRNA; r:17684-18217
MAATLEASAQSVSVVALWAVVGGGASFLVGPPIIDSSEFRYKRTAAAYFLYFYLIVFFQSVLAIKLWDEVKKKDKKVSLWEVKFGPLSYTDRRIVASNRTVGNTLEQMAIFLVGLWLTTLLTTDDHASICGWVYVIFRSMYPALYLYDPNLVLLATIPNYCTVAYLWVTIVRACFVS